MCDMLDQRRRDPFEEPGEVYQTGVKPGAMTLTQHLPAQRKAGTGAAAAPMDGGDYSFVQAYGGEVKAPGSPPFADDRPTAWMAGETAPASSGSGQPLERGVRGQMERSFNADFSAVRVHEGDQATAIGAHAYTRGADLHFGPGQYAPESEAGRALLGHELAHVVQQAEGRVTATAQAKGVAINDDSALEREADEQGARAARGEPVGDAGRAPVVAGAAGSVQRLAFVGGTQATNTAGVSPAKQAMVSDDVVRDYTDDAEFTKHAARSTDYLGNLTDGTWLRFSPTGINLLGENHTLVRAEDTVPAVNSKSFIYEPFSVDDMSKSPEMKAAYEKENAERFKTFGVDGVADKQQFGEESLYPKLGYNMVLALPYFTKARSLDELKPAGYVGQPIQRYLKISWGMTADAETKVAADRLAKTPVEPKFGKMADTHTALKAELGPFITALPLEGFLGDELTKPGNDKLLPSLAKYATAVENAMIELAATDPSSRLDQKTRDRLAKKGAKDEDEKEKIFSEWRDFKFEDSVADATAKGVRYAGMGQNHLKHLIAKGLTADQHPYKMADVDLAKFQADTVALKATAVKASFDPTTLTTAELLKSWGTTADPAEKTGYEAELKKRSLKVTVKVTKAQEGPDEVYVKASCGGREFKSPQLKMKSGDAHVFLVPLSALWPVKGDLAVQVFDWDALSKDDLISNILMRDPWHALNDKQPWDGAEYDTTAEFEK